MVVIVVVVVVGCRHLPEQAALDEKKRQKKLLNAVHDVKQMKKDLVKMAREKKERKDWIQLQKNNTQININVMLHIHIHMTDTRIYTFMCLSYYPALPLLS